MICTDSRVLCLFSTLDTGDDELVPDEMDLRKAVTLDDEFTRHVCHRPIEFISSGDESNLEVAIQLVMTVHLTVLEIADKISGERLDGREHSLSLLGEERHACSTSL